MGRARRLPVTGIGEENWDIRGSSAVPPMTPIAALADFARVVAVAHGREQ